MILDNFSETNNFWDFNPQFKIILKEFYNKDKSKHKEESSKIMWAIFLLNHPKSEFYYLEDKENLIAKNYLKNSKFKWDDYKDITDIVLQNVLTQAEKSLVNWETTLKKRDEFIHAQEFTLDYYNDDDKLVKGSADQLDKMLANTNKLYAEYFKIVKEIREEELAKARGNKIKSMSDSGEI